MSLNDSDQEDREVLLAGNRYAARRDNNPGHSELEAPGPARPRRRLVLVSQNSDAKVSDREWDSDTNSIGGTSDVEVNDVPAPTVPETPFCWSLGMGALASRDLVNLREVFNRRARRQMKVAVQEILARTDRSF